MLSPLATALLSGARDEEHVDDYARPDSWAAQSRAAQAAPRITGSLSPEQVEALLRAYQWNEEWARRASRAVRADVDGNLNWSGAYQNTSEGRTIRVAPQWEKIPKVIEHEYQHWYDDTWGEPGMDGPGLEAELRPYVQNAGYPVFGRAAELGLKQNATDPAHTTHRIIDAIARAPGRMPPAVAAGGRFGWLDALEQAGRSAHRVLIPVVPSR